MTDIKNKAMGIGLRSPHYQAVLDTKPDVDFLEIHSENYFNIYSKEYFYLEQIAENYPISFHGVGGSLGSSDPLDKGYLQQLKHLVDRFHPILVSDHLSWCSFEGNFFNDLLPVPYTKEALRCFSDNVNQVQNILQRQILIENPSSYLEYKNIDMNEPEFINEICKQTGCGLLLDLNNIYISATNQQLSVQKYLDEIDQSTVQEIHLAGFTKQKIKDNTLLIDTHSTFIDQAVWDIYQNYVKQTQTQAITLIEWDLEIPNLTTLIEQMNKANVIREAENEFKTITNAIF